MQRRINEQGEKPRKTVSRQQTKVREINNTSASLQPVMRLWNALRRRAEGMCRRESMRIASACCVSDLSWGLMFPPRRMPSYAMHFGSKTLLRCLMMCIWVCWFCSRSLAMLAKRATGKTCWVIPSFIVASRPSSPLRCAREPHLSASTYRELEPSPVADRAPSI